MKKCKMETLNEFSKLISELRNKNKSILNSVCKNKKVDVKKINFLKKSLKTFESIKKDGENYILSYEKNKIKTKLSYEISEIKKDIIFLKKGEGALLDYLSKSNKNFRKETKNMIDYLKDKKIQIWITDRDGTINNYGERYFSTNQSVYNAFFLTKFLDNVKKTIILTSAPLKDFFKLNIISKKRIIYSGSKGREFFYARKKFNMPLSKSESEILGKLAKKINSLILNNNYKKFSLIGSGLQIKCGQISIARQDIHNSISKKESENFFKEIKKIVYEIDPKNKYFAIEDTGLDVEIILKLKNKKNFDKGHGISFILNKLKIKRGNVLVCGDTTSDLSLIKASKKFGKEIYVIFVTRNQKLKKQVRNLVSDAKFVSNPDTLVSSLYLLSKKI